MSGLNGMNGRIQRLEARRPAASPDRWFPLEELNDEDRVTFLAEGLTTGDGRYAWDALTDEQRSRFGYWWDCLCAQASQDADRAAFAHRRLALSFDELVARFCALDVSELPDDLYTGPSVAIGTGLTYYFNKASYGWVLRTRLDEKGSVCASDAEYLWRWVEFMESRGDVWQR